MKPSPDRRPRRSPVRARILATALFLLAAATLPGAGRAEPVRLPPVPEHPEFGWVRQPFFESLPPWPLDPVLFPPASLALPPRPPAPADKAWDLLRQGAALAAAAARKPGDAGGHEEAARLLLRAYAADKGGAAGYLALRLAARSYFLGGHWTEAAGVATTLVRASGGGGAALPFYLLKGEALYQKRDLLGARECFRRALGGRFDASVKTRIELRVADASFELGNVAYAEPAYRKALGGDAAARRLPFNAIRHGEAMLAAGKGAEAAARFRSLADDADGVPPLARAVALLGLGDAAILAGNLVEAQSAVERAASLGEFPETRDLLRMRQADLAFLGGKRDAALAGYSALTGSPYRSLAREAGYKKALALYLTGDLQGAVRESQVWFTRHAGKPGERGMRALAARAGADLVRAAGKANPADRYPALSAFLHAYGRSREFPALLGEIGAEWEAARIWEGAADLYAAAGDAARSADMRRVGRAESAYWRGDLPGVLSALGWSEPSKERSPAGAWLAARTFFRQSRYAEADAALRRLEALRAESGAPGGADPFPPERELAAFSRALQGRRAELAADLKSVPAQSSFPGLPVLRRMAGPTEEPPGRKPQAGGTNPSAGRDVYEEYARIRDRMERRSGGEEAP